MTLMLRAVSASDLGLIRNNNEDALHAGRRLIAVADGMGGLPAGEMASGIVIRALSPVDGDDDPGDRAGDLLREAIDAANAEIRRTAEEDPAREGMGTTVTALLLHGDHLALLHVGDSRGYLLRDGRLTQITRDDTLVQGLVDQGVITAAEARHHPHRSLVTQAVQGARMTPTEAELDARVGDRLLLCSDGLSDVVGDDAIAATLADRPAAPDCVAALIELARQAGGPDNITVIVADVVEE